MSTTDYRALALDLDGTLMDSKKQLSQKNKQAVWAAIDKGVSVILASGRPIFGVMPVADMLELKERGGYVLAFNGGRIVDCSTGEIIYGNYLPEGCIKDICEVARKHMVSPLTYYEDRILTENEKDEYVIKELFCNSAQAKEVPDIVEFVNYPVEKMLVVGPHEKLLPVKKELSDRLGESLDFFFSEDYFLEVVPKGIRKDKCLGVLLEKLGIDRKQLIACGDGMNDINMIEYAGLGVAMENAYPPVKEKGDIIAPSNDLDGVAWVIEKYLL